ncbi:MAG: MFS transporter [Alphaproteobacteria bacterium]|nr:MFS transporter [Alphaproteobacteria bacterium]
MGKVMGAFAAASVLGIPFGLEIARLFGWRAPFLVLALGAMGVIVMAWFFLPRGKNTKNSGNVTEQLSYIGGCLRNPTALSAFAFMGLSMMSGFMIIPNFSAHLQMNLDYPREHLGILYFCGGLISFFSMRWVGKWIDRTSATHAAVGSTALFILVTCVGFIWYPNPIPAVVIFVTFMVSMSSRSVAAQTLASKVPRPDERGSYMSLQSSVTHLSSAIGAFLSSQILTHSADNRLIGVDRLGIMAIAVSIIVPFLFYFTEKRLHISRGHPAPDPAALA